jgi:glycosyltransferase involved in cell wall biosynthesis
MKFPGISIIIACLNEDHYIGECIDSILNQSYIGETEIIIADGGSTDNTLQIINEYKQHFSNIILINNPEKIQAAGRNHAINISKYDFIAYIDAHSYPKKNWLYELYTAYLEISQKDDKIAGIGSVYSNASEKPFSKTVFAITKSFLIGATSNHYLNQNNISKVHNASMCLYKKDIFEKFGYFDETLKVGEDIELNQRLTFKYKYNIYVNPSAMFFYYPRDNFVSLFKQQFRYGYWRQIVNNKNNLFSIKSIVPGLFLLFMMVLLLLSIFSSMLLLLFSSLLVSYLLLIIIGSVYLSFKSRVNPALVLLVTITIHISYGLGGIYSFLNRNI